MPAGPENKGFIARTWRRLRSPSARWSILALVVVGFVVGAVSIIGTQVMVHVTGTNEFCGTACHSHQQSVYPEYKASVHGGATSKGLGATCHDCHIPKNYPELLWYKAKAGTRDAIGEIRGVISTPEKFKAERERMAQHVWDEYKGNNSQACRNCHQFTPESLAKQKEFHATTIRDGKMTCIECHKGVAHVAPGG